MICETCKNPLSGRQTKFCSIKCKNSSTNIKHQHYEYQQQRGLDRKIQLVIMLGGKCSSCPYDANLAALDFHHLRDKKFQLDLRHLSNGKWESLVAEANKCILLCANCHREHHNPQMNNWKPMDAVGIEPTQ